MRRSWVAKDPDPDNACRLTERGKALMLAEKSTKQQTLQTTANRPENLQTGSRTTPIL
jgi:hypothetical protein